METEESRDLEAEAAELEERERTLEARKRDLEAEKKALRAEAASLEGAEVKSKKPDKGAFLGTFGEAIRTHRSC